MPSNTPARRAVLATGAWSIPVVAMGAAAPLAAASQCLPATINWNNTAVGDRPTTIPVPGVVPALTATFGVSYSAGSTPSAASGTVAAGPQGASTIATTAWNSLSLTGTTPPRSPSPSAARCAT